MVVMTLFTLMQGMMGIKMSIPEMISGMLGGNIIIGWIMHFIIGIVLAVNYGAIFYSKIKIQPIWICRAFFGLLPWLMAQTLVIPMMTVINGIPFSYG